MKRYHARMAPSVALGQLVSSLTLASICGFSIDSATARPPTMNPPSAASGTAMAMNSNIGAAAR